MVSVVWRITRGCEPRGTGFDPRRIPSDRNRESGFRDVLLGEQRASKTRVRGSNPHARACCRRGSTEKGVRLVSGTMLVRIQSSALWYLSRWCSGSHWSVRSSRSWFDSRSGYSRVSPASVPEARQPSKLQDEVRFLGGALMTRNRPRGVPDSHATLRRSKTRFNSWRGHLNYELTTCVRDAAPWSDGHCIS